MKEKTQTIGNWGEDLACKYLLSKGYKILGRNMHLGNQELDILCRFDGLSVVVEVKTKRKSKAACAEEMMSKDKLKNLKILAGKLIARRLVKSSALRFDLVAIELDQVAKKAKIRHYKGII